MKSKKTAWLLALFLWWIWIHKFYLWKNGQWILYLLFVRSWIPVVLGIIDSIRLFSMDDKVFFDEYNNPKSQAEKLVEKEREIAEAKIHREKRINELRKRMWKHELKTDGSPIQCPKCNSTQLTSNQKWFSVWNALALGVVGWFIGSKKIVISCMNCGHSRTP